MKKHENDKKNRPPNDLFEQTASSQDEAPKVIKATNLGDHQQNALSRRGFLKGSFFSGASAAAAISSVSGCGSGDDDSDDGSSQTISTNCTTTFHLSHSSRVNDLAFSPDGTRLISGSLDTTVKIWDTASGALLHTCNGHGINVNAVAYSPLGDCFVSAGEDHQVVVWDSSGSQLLSYSGHNGPVYSVAFSSDGTQVASSDVDGNVHVWAVTTGTLAYALKPTSTPVYAVAFSPNASMLAIATHSDVQIWDVTGHHLFTYRGHASAVFDVAFSPDSSKIATIGANRTCRIWEPLNGNLLMTFSCQVNNKLVSVAFSPNGEQIASASSLTGVSIWDATLTGGQVASEGLLTVGAGSCVAFRPSTGESFVTLYNTPSTILCEYSATTGQAIGFYGDNSLNQVSLNSSCSISGGSSFGCTCNSVCSCDTVCTCNTVEVCTCDSVSSHYWYPN
jgi:WD40 repeat protein